MITLDIQNPCGFDSIPRAEDVQCWVEAALQGDNGKTSALLEMAIRFVDEDEGLALNQRYRQKTSATNVLSFPFEAPDFGADIPELNEALTQQGYLGDLVLCEKVVKTEAAEQNKTLQQHWAHLIVHGVLHLQGYDHIDDGDADVMESLEINILNKLDFNNPYE